MREKERYVYTAYLSACSSRGFLPAWRGQTGTWGHEGQFTQQSQLTAFGLSVHVTCMLTGH